VAVGGITAAFGALLQAFFGLGIWMPLGVVGLILAISGPSMAVAWLKLRKRNLGPILDANGWAVNTLTKVNIPLGTSLTEMPKLPAGSERSLVDPYAPKKSIWPIVLVWLLILGGITYGLYYFNLLNQWTNGWFPAHHKEVALATEGPTTAAPGGSIVFVVKSSDDELEVSDPTDSSLKDKVKVDGGKATWAIKADLKPGTYVVRDGASGTEVTVTVALPEAPK
jgi:hypothetical protein